MASTFTYGHYGRDLLLELQRCRDVTTSASLSSASGMGSSLSAASLLPAYQDELVANALQDVRLHVQALHDQHQAVVLQSQAAAATAANANGADAVSHKPSLAVRPSLLLQTAAIQRNKQCLLAYHVERVRRMSHLYWIGCDEHLLGPNFSEQPLSSSSVSSSYKVPSQSSGSTARILCPAERDFLQRYRSLIANYAATACGALGQANHDLLRAHGSHPPSPTDRVQVRVPATDASGNQHKNEQEKEEEDGAIVLESGTVVQLTPGSTHYLLWSDVEDYVRKGRLQILEGEEES